MDRVFSINEKLDFFKLRSCFVAPWSDFSVKKEMGTNSVPKKEGVLEGVIKLKTMTLRSRK